LPITYGRGDTRGLLTRIISTARAKNASAFIGDGANRWPSVHVLDAARLFRLALESLPAGAAVHAVAGEGTPIRALAEAIGRHLGVPVASIAAADALTHFGWLGSLLGRNVPASSAVARDLLGWEPTQPALLADLEAGHYFT
jgi:nucleoside-diphosphate-sugar epimerase